MLKPFWVDLHIHTLLSPCGELEMGAPEIVERAREAGLDVIGIADHNTCENFPGIHEAAAGVPVVLPCIETQSAEDIHILCVFPDYETAAGYKEWLWRRIRPIPNDVEHFGYQIVVDANNEIVKEEETLLIQGAGYEVDQIVSKTKEVGGIPILAHVDRPAFSYPAALGPMPDDYPAEAFELSSRLDHEEAQKWRERYPGRTFIRSSDSHTLETMSRANCTKMMLEEPTFDEIKKAIRGEDGRRISWPWG
ncbi:PHP domain-containing protein [Cloacibacillus evryensis]|uniref:PHP domain-containing protein n=1 Tax=Cloacibacillus evryensis TaxID=508460 RepID=UPI0004BC607E|nr:PHP domain-containing protein [Cloacibacillus evryensis]MEA5035286.1 histidinol-phosphatase [Cloacibacillus evryensis]